MVLWIDIVHISFETISENSEFIGDEITSATIENQRHILAFEWLEKTTDFQ